MDNLRQPPTASGRAAPSDDGQLARAWRAVHALARPWTPPPRRTVVVVPHPDDESLSTGGLIAHQCRAAVPVVVIAVTDGDAAYRPEGDAELAEIRRREQHSALAILGGTDIELVSVGIPDGRIEEFSTQLLDVLAVHIRTKDLVVMPWIGDHHPDHVATTSATLVAATNMDVDVKFGLFWAWHLTPPQDFRHLPLLSLELAPDMQHRKSTALECHRSQTTSSRSHTPILTRQLTEPARWSREFYVDSNAPATIAVSADPSTFVG
jgi:LmbE family N-acetylglucosaminyl deacetylase